MTNEPSIDFFIIILFIPVAIMGFILFSDIYDQSTPKQPVSISVCEKYIIIAQTHNMGELDAFNSAPTSCGGYDQFITEWKNLKNTGGQ